MRTDSEQLLDQWRTEHEQPVEGWDFSSLAGRYVEEQPPWSYDQLARAVLAGSMSALDMGTGGGEKLLELRDALPQDTVATEGWPPNIPVAAAALAPAGIDVVDYDAEAAPAMPFEDGRFHVVLNRHEAYVATEVFRVLGPGGTFFTQQVDGRSFEETQAWFGGRSGYPHVTLDNLRAEALDAGLMVDRAEDWVGSCSFADVGALVRYFAIVPWEVPEDFTVERYADQLLALHHRCLARGEPIAFTQRRFYLLARKPT